MTDSERELCSNPFVAANFAKAIMVEQIMALIGRSSERPNDYRRTLYGFEIATLRRTLEELTEGFDFPAPAEALNHSAEANPRVPNGDVQETREDHQNRSELPVRELLTLQPTLP